MKYSKNKKVKEMGEPSKLAGRGRGGISWEDNIKVDLRERRQSSLNWITVAHARGQLRVLVNTVVNLRFHKMLRTL
jgi:hypothetical protein